MHNFQENEILRNENKKLKAVANKWKKSRGCNTDRSLWNLCHSRNKKVFSFFHTFYLCDISRVFWSNNSLSSG